MSMHEVISNSENKLFDRDNENKRKVHFIFLVLLLHGRGAAVLPT